MTTNRTAAFLGTEADRRHCRLTVSNSSQAGWCVFLDGEGRLAVVLIHMLMLGPAPTERRFQTRLSPAAVETMFACCVEHDLMALQGQVPPIRVCRPGEPEVALTLRNAAREHLKLRKPIGVDVPALDAVARAAFELTRTIKDREPEYAGPWRSMWTPWKDLDGRP